MLKKNLKGTKKSIPPRGPVHFGMFTLGHGIKPVAYQKKIIPFVNILSVNLRI